MPDPHVYPEAPSGPLLVAAAPPPPKPGVQTETNSGPQKIEQLAVADPSTPWVAKTMFIRVAMSGAPCLSAIDSTAPNIYLTANGGKAALINDHTVAEGSSQTIFIPNPTPGQPPIYVADGLAILDDKTHNIFLITVLFQDAAGNYDWSLTIGNIDTASAREFTWVVSATKDLTAQPWIDVEPTTLAWDVLIGGSLGEPVTISNKGTVAFTVKGLSAALPAGFTLGPLPGMLEPGKSASLTVTFAGPPAPPAPDGTTKAVANVNIDPQDKTAGAFAGHNNQLSLSALTQALEVMILLDDSGSMSWTPKGKGGLPPKDPSSRWGELTDALNNEFFKLLGFFGEGRGKFGIAIFPPTNPADPATFDLLNPPKTIPNAAGMSIATTPVAGVIPTNGTPMGNGIDRVFGPTTSYFATDSVSTAANRRWLLLMTDGAENIFTPHQAKDYLLPKFGGTAAGDTSFVDKKVSLFAIGYGIKTYSDVNDTILQQLADSSYNKGGVRRPDDDGLTATQVASAFRDAIKAGITKGSSPGDPSAVFYGGQREARHFALITQYDTKAAFVLSWNTPDPQRLRLELITPTCDILTPETAGQGAFTDVTFVAGNRSQMYLIGPGFLRNTGGQGNPRYGTWTLRVTSPALTVIEGQAFWGSENYDYDIIVDSDLRMAVTLDQGSYYAGDPIRVSARLIAAGKPVTGASVTVSTTAPAVSENNWLAALDVPAEFIDQARQLTKGDTTDILVKKVAAGLAGMVFPGADTERATAMTDARGIATYEATITNTSVPETYTFYVTATGVTDDNVTFRREAKVVTSVLVRPDPAFTTLSVDFGQQGTGQAIVIPRDRFRNVLLVNPASVPGFGLNIQGGNFSGPLVSQLNGTYTQPFTANPGMVPVIGVTFNGDTIQQQTVPPIADLVWVNEVVEFVRGAEASPGANKHTNPNDALGDPRTKPADQFVALGATGSLAVAVKGQLILAQGEADVTVFVWPDTDLRPYRVEALRGRDHDQDDWVPLGTSPGTTASFRLSDANLHAARAIRIIDTSGRTRGTNFQPLATPGVSIRAVGVRKAGKHDGGGEGDVCIRIRVLDRQRNPLGGTVDIEFKPQESGETMDVRHVDASKDIDVRGLQRTPRGLYLVTVTPTDVFRPVGQFVTIPASGFNTVEFVIDKRAKQDH